MARTRAAVMVKPEAMEIREFPLPEISQGDALLRMEACGMCGTDYELYYGQIKPNADPKGQPGYPFIPGHEPVGIIEKIGAEASARWGVKAGDRVALGATGGIGLTGTWKAPSLWGGYAEYMYVSPNARVFPVSRSAPIEAVATYNAAATGLHWGVLLPELRVGQSIVILGPGQRGLAALVAARVAGASFVAITGLTRDAYKLDVARALGADLVIDSEKEDVAARVQQAVPEGVDVVLDTTPYAAEPFLQALSMIRRGGTVVVAGIKGGNQVTLSTDLLVRKLATIRSAGSPPDEAVRAGLKLIEAGKFPYKQLVTHQFPLEKAGEALQTLAGKIPDRKAINVILMPNG